MATEPVPNPPDLAAAQVEKVRAETAKLAAEARKLEQEALAVPRMATGSAMSETIKVIGAVVLGIGGFVTAVGSYFVARNQVEVAELKATYANEKAQAAQATASAASAAAAAALKLRDAARQQEAEAARNAADLRTTLAELTARIQAAKPDLVKRRLVYVQFQGSLTRVLVNSLRTSLESTGFTAPGAERIDGGYQSLVKYFRPEDEPSAMALLKATQDFFASNGCPIQLRVVKATAAASSPPLELWLAHTCKSQ